MVEINVYNDIANKKDGVFMSMFGMDDAVFSADKVKDIFSKNTKEKEFKFNIHCDGGSVSEGLAIYDIIRNSGKTIFTNIEGGCHSMAIILLLSAPFENRTANANARALIHKVRSYSMEAMTADEMREMAEYIEQEESAILDIYEDRTKTARAELENLMREEKQRTAKELLNYGFISKINTYSTNQKKSQMSKQTKNEVLNAADKFLRKLKNLINPDDAVNFDFTDEDGNVLFSTEKEDDTLAVGDAASPDGTFELPDGRTVTIADGAVTEITEAIEPSETEELENRIEELENALSEAKTLITDLKNQIGSNYKAKNRMANPKGGRGQSAEDLKNELAEKRAKFKGGK